MDSKLKSFIIMVLRRASYRWPGRYNALKTARVGRGEYKCAKCGNIFKRDQVQVDHIEPVVPTDKGFTTFDEYIKRMFVDETGFQVLCSTCHDEKTDDENKKRKEAKKSLTRKTRCVTTDNIYGKDKRNTKTIKRRGTTLSVGKRSTI